MYNLERMPGYGDAYDDQYERELAQSDKENEMMADYEEDCRKIAENSAIEFYLADIESRPETMAEKQAVWESWLIQEAELVGKDEKEAMYLHIDYGWADFVDWSFTIKTAKAKGVYTERPEIITD